MVKVQSENGNFFKTAAIVYLLPLVLALVFYGVASALSLGGEGLHALCAGIGFVLGILVAVAWDRHMKKVSGLRFKTLNAICKELDCPPGDLLEFVDDEEG